MKKILSSLLIASLAASLLVACQLKDDSKAPKTSLTTKEEKVSYSLGLDIGTSIKALDYKVDLDIFMQALRDTLEGGKILLTAEEVKTVMTEWSKEQREVRKQKADSASKKNETDGIAFLEKNKTAKGVTTTASGLQYKVIKEGTGVAPVDSDKVEIHYTGKTIAGKVFDSSVKRGKSITMDLARSIPGWKEGLKLMKEGGKAELYIPSALAYGSRQAGPDIGPNSTLIFEVELIKVNPAPKAPVAPKVTAKAAPKAKVAPKATVAPAPAK